MSIRILATCLLGLFVLTEPVSKVPVSAVQLEISKAHDPSALLHWRIHNVSRNPIYVYDYYLWGPAFRVTQTARSNQIETAPISEEPSCPPNRVPPVLLLHLAPGKSIEGDFADDQVKLDQSKPVSLTITAGSEPYEVTLETQRFANSNCKHSPYDAIVRWGTVIESNSIRLP